MRTYSIGGGFGRRLNGDYAVPTALAAKALSRPVKLVLTRSDDTRFDSFRSPSSQTLRLAFDAQSKVTAMEHHASAGWPTAVMDSAGMWKTPDGAPYDLTAIAGADHWYSVGTQRVRALSNDLANSAFRPGWLRSVGPGWTNWALESFMDEAALMVRADPVVFRIGLLDGAGRNAGSAPNAVGGATRQAAVLASGREAGWAPHAKGWGSASPPRSPERAMPTWAVCVARVHGDAAAAPGRKPTIVVDAGTVVHPDGALAPGRRALWGPSMRSMRNRVRQRPGEGHKLR
jgi:CO/xanthine dehydrogenase Mo-binding subunit